MVVSTVSLSGCLPDRKKIHIFIGPSPGPLISQLNEEPSMSLTQRNIAFVLAPMLFARALMPAGAAESFNRAEVEHRFGTDPSFTHYPERAIDSDDAPNIVLHESDAEDSPLKVYPLGSDTYLFFGNIAEVDENNRGWNGNAGFVVTNDGVVVIDALGSPKLGRRMIATIRGVTTRPIRYLILTHNHPDHAYGAVAFRRLGGVTIVGHKGLLKYLDSDRIGHSVAYRKAFIPTDMAGFEAVRPDVLVDVPRFSSYDFRLGGKHFQVYNAGHHHSYGDLVVNQVEDHIVWISDLAFNHRVTFMADGSSQQALEGQDWLLKHFAGARLMVPGHGSAQTSPFPMVSATHEYVQRLRRTMGRAVEEGVDLQEAVDGGDFPEWRGERLYHLNHRANLNFVYREMEEALF